MEVLISAPSLCSLDISFRFFKNIISKFRKRFLFLTLVKSKIEYGYKL